jgi:ribosomal protein L7/L12
VAGPARSFTERNPVGSDAEDIRNLKIEVARLTQIVDLLAKRAGIGQGALLSADDAAPADVVEALRAGNKILAIKQWRERTNVSLAEAKHAVEQLERTLL